MNIDITDLFELLFCFRDGKPYCEKDYQAEYGVTCAGCGGYIIGKVLQVNQLQLNLPLRPPLVSDHLS